MLLLHIILAVLSLLVGATAVFGSEFKNVRLYFLTSSLTILSGIGLLFNGYSLTHTCIAGGLYTVATFWVGLALHKKLSAQEI